MSSRMSATKRVLSKLADSLVVIIKGSEIDEATVHEAIAKSFQSQKVTPPHPEAALVLDSTTVIGAMLSRWRSDPTYSDDLGEPLAIGRSGPAPSLETLFADTVAADTTIPETVTADDSIDRLIEADVLREAEPELFIPTQSWFPTNTGGSSGALTHLSYLSEFAGTVARNAVQPGKGREQFITRVRRFPTKHLPILSGMMRNDGIAFIESVDDYLENHRTPSDVEGETAHVGVGLYLFVEYDEED